MANSTPTIQFAAQLLRQDQSLTELEYKEYRMKLELSLSKAELAEKRAVTVAAGSFAVAMALMFVGGSKIVGDFDPWSKGATALSVMLGGIWVLCSVTWPLACAAALTRFRPRVKDLKEQLRDASILALHSEIAELRKQISSIPKSSL